jgi:DNA gyrase subunit B
VAKKKEYNADSIVRLKGLEGVRVRPTMYIGDVDDRGLLHLVKEIIGNCIDEAMSGHGDIIAIKVDKKGMVTVFDQGRGIPTGPHKSDKKVDTLTIIATELHSGGKLKDTAENYSAGATIGTHGVGLAVVNALSTQMTIWTKSSGKWQQQEFSKGLPVSGVEKASKVPSFNKKPWSHGTIVQFQPDLSVFAKGAKLNLKDIYQWLSQLSWFVYGPKASKKDTHGTPITYSLDLNGKLFMIKRKSLEDYAFYTAKNKLKAAPLLPKLTPFVYSSKGCDVLYYPTESDASVLYAAVSAVETMAGGTHVTEFRKIFTGVLNRLRTKRQEFTIDDFLVGSITVCNVKMTDAAFAGQSKERLTSKIENQFVGLEEALLKWFKANKKAMAVLFARAVELNSMSNNAALNKKLAAALKTKKGGKLLMPTGLIGSTTKNRDEREMFILEGASAGGTAKKASDRKYQEIMLLRGKILNVVKGFEKMTDSKVIVDVLKAVGFDPKVDFAKSRRVGKVYLLTDPDPDGSHISCLLMGLLYTVVPSLFNEGRMYDVDAPLYSYNDVKIRAYGSSLAELKTKVGKGFNIDRVVRMKGWGEAEPIQLNELAFNPKTRKVVQISTAKAAESKKAMMAILGEGSEFRKDLLGLSV